MKEKFIGAWELVSFHFANKEGGKMHPYGEDAKGLLTYTAGGSISVIMGANNRPKAESDDLKKVSDIEFALMGRDFAAYYGNYLIDEGDETVVHNLDYSFFPNWLAVPQKRFYKFEGDTLELSTGYMQVGGIDMKGYVVWKKRD